MDLVYAILSGLIPPLIWLFFWTREDAHPEPRTLLFACFIGGALAVICSGIGENIIGSIITNEQNKYVAWAAIEEIFKFVAVFAIALNRPDNDEPIDAMMYCITVALGFAAIENTLFIMGQLNTGGLAVGLMAGNMRFIGPTLLHTISSSIVGFSYGYVFYHGRIVKLLAVTIGLGAAITAHALFNLSILNAGSIDTLKIFGLIWFAIVVLIALFEEIKAVRPHKSVHSILRDI